MKKLFENYIYIKTKAVTFNNIINRLYQYKINIYKSKYVEKDVYLKINYNDYKKFIKYFDDIYWERVQYSGFIFYKNLLKNNISYFIILILSIVFMSFCLNMIFDIKYNFEDKYLQKLISNKLYDYGIRKFSFKKNYYDIELIKKKIKNDLKDDLEWIEITPKGMIYQIDVQRRIIKKQEIKNSYCNVVAKKDGLVKNIIINEGVTMVHQNDYVKNGDILISGDVIYNDEVKDITCASGKIMAEVWYIVNVSVPIVNSKLVLGNKKRNNLIINYDDYDIKVFRDRLEKYKSTKKKVFDALGIKVYLEKQTELIKKEIKLSKKEAVNLGVEEAKEKVLLKLKDSDEIVSEKILQKSINNSTIELEIFIVANEDIAQQNILMEGN